MRTGQLNGVEYTYNTAKDLQRDAEDAAHDPNPVPKSVTRFQLKIALRRDGKIDDVQTVLDNPATDPEIVDAWADMSIFGRNSPAVTVVGTALGFTDTQIDNLFRTAGLI